MIRPKLNDGMLPGMCHLHATSFNAVKYGINLQKWHVAAAALLLLYIHDSRALIWKKFSKSPKFIWKICKKRPPKRRKPQKPRRRWNGRKEHEKGKEEWQECSTSSRNVRMTRISYGFHLKLKHVLGGVTLLSLLAAFEVFSIPAANGIIDLMAPSRAIAGLTWFLVAIISGGAAIVLYEDDE